MITQHIVDEHVLNYIQGLLPEETGFLAELKDYGETHLVPIIQPEIAQYLKVFFSIARPKSVLELGTAIGYSACLMGTYMNEGTIDTIEINEEMAKLAEGHFERFEALHPKVKVTLHRGDGLEVIKTLNKSFDMIFIDAAKGHYKAFLELCMPMLNEGGVIVSDNVLYKGMVATNLYLVRRKITIVKRMRQYLTYISEHPELDTTILPMGDGLAISYKRRSTTRETR